MYSYIETAEAEAEYTRFSICVQYRVLIQVYWPTFDIFIQNVAYSVIFYVIKFLWLDSTNQSVFSATRKS